MIRNGDKLRVQAIYAAPFHNEKSVSPKDGMEKSFSEILTLLALLGREDLNPCVFKGSETYLHDEETPVPSSAARDLAERAMRYTPENPLYVIAIGAITNVASAILINPAIRERIVVVWLGGNALHWPDNREFNLAQDVAAARILFGCGVPLVQLPCMGVVSSFTVSEPELRQYLLGKKCAVRPPRAVCDRGRPPHGLERHVDARHLGCDRRRLAARRGLYGGYARAQPDPAVRPHVDALRNAAFHPLCLRHPPRPTARRSCAQTDRVIFGTHFSIKCVPFSSVYGIIIKNGTAV